MTKPRVVIRRSRIHVDDLTNKPFSVKTNVKIFQIKIRHVHRGIYEDKTIAITITTKSSTVNREECSQIKKNPYVTS